MESRIYRELYESYQHLYDLNESVEEQEIIIGYLLDEGFTDSVEGAMVIMESMSDQWYSVIVEGLAKKDTQNKSEMAAEIANLRKKQKELTSKLDTKNPDPKIVKQIQNIIAEIKKLSSATSSLRQITGDSEPSRITQKRKESKEAPLTPGEREALRDTRSAKPTGTPEERKKRREDIAAGAQRAKRAKYGSSPQTPKSGERAAPDRTRETSKQRDVTRETETTFINPAVDPSGARMTYRTATGERLLNLAGKGDVTQRPGRGAERTRGVFQQGGSGASETGASLPGSTERRARPRRIG